MKAFYDRILSHDDVVMRTGAEILTGTGRRESSPEGTATMLPKVLLVSLRSTITMTSGAAGGIVPMLTGEDLVRAIPALAKVAVIEALFPFRLPGASLSLASCARSLECSMSVCRVIAAAPSSSRKQIL